MNKSMQPQSLLIDCVAERRGRSLNSQSWLLSRRLQVLSDLSALRVHFRRSTLHSVTKQLFTGVKPKLPQLFFFSFSGKKTSSSRSVTFDTTV